MIQQLVWSSWYEGLRMMRRAGLPVLLGVWFLGSIVGFLFFENIPISIIPQEFMDNTTLAQNATLMYINNSLMVSFAIVNIAAMFGGVAIPIMNAELFALDKQNHILSWHDALPVSSWQYLLAKITAVFTILLTAILTISVASGLFYRWQYGAFDVWFYVQGWLVLMIPMILFVSFCVMLVTIICRTRRQALVLGVVVTCAIYIWLASEFFIYQLNKMFSYIDSNKVIIGDILCEAEGFCDVMPDFGSAAPLGNWQWTVVQMTAVAYILFLLAWAWQERQRYS